MSAMTLDLQNRCFFNVLDNKMQIKQDAPSKKKKLITLVNKNNTKLNTNSLF